MSNIRVGFEVEASAARLKIVLNALVCLNLLEMSAKKYPPLYRSGVRYRREPQIPGRYEQWLTIKDLVARGHGDCEDLASTRVAELRRLGVRAIPWLLKNGPTWHVVVRYPDGRIEDPSRILGMGKE
jgi:hypothetical protein